LKGKSVKKIRLGKTELMVTQIGFGGIPIQRLSDKDAVKVVRRCLELGINFYDTANGYTTSEERIGKAIKGKREDVYIATKTGARTHEEIEKHLDLSLERLGTDYIDIYQFHGVNDRETLDKILDPEDGLYNTFMKAKKAGKIRHIGITSHKLDEVKEQVKTGYFETVMFPFNFITCEPADELLPLCREHDVGFINMKPMAGGMLENAAVAFKYLFQFPDIAIIPGIEKVHEIEEIVSLYENSHEMTAAEEEKMEQLRKELGARFCRRCDYCQPCQQEIPISLLMTFPSFVKRLPPDWYMKNPRIGGMMEKAADCIECGECEARCPYNLPIREMIKENYELFQKIKAAHPA
jgi:predicted aldo/keto reductase-like oxidoreductase